MFFRVGEKETIMAVVHLTKAGHWVRRTLVDTVENTNNRFNNKARTRTTTKTTTTTNNNNNNNNNNIKKIR